MLAQESDFHGRGFVFSVLSYKRQESSGDAGLRKQARYGKEAGLGKRIMTA